MSNYFQFSIFKPSILENSFTLLVTIIASWNFVIEAIKISLGPITVPSFSILLLISAYMYVTWSSKGMISNGCKNFSIFSKVFSGVCPRAQRVLQRLTGCCPEGASFSAQGRGKSLVPYCWKPVTKNKKVWTTKAVEFTKEESTKVFVFHLPGNGKWKGNLFENR